MQQAGIESAVASVAAQAAPARWRPPRLWQVLVQVARVVLAPVGRLRVTGDVPPALRDGPVLFVVNHIGPFDPIAITAACGAAGLAPRLMATGGASTSRAAASRWGSVTVACLPRVQGRCRRAAGLRRATCAATASGPGRA